MERGNICCHTTQQVSYICNLEVVSQYHLTNREAFPLLTAHWESWWRSEDLYSHNHPMLTASAEWMVSSVAGVSLSPTTSGGKEVIFWPRFPNSAKDLTYASAVSYCLNGSFDFGAVH